MLSYGAVQRRLLVFEKVEVHDVSSQKTSNYIHLVLHPIPHILRYTYMLNQYHVYSLNPKHFQQIMNAALLHFQYGSTFFLQELYIPFSYQKNVDLGGLVVSHWTQGSRVRSRQRSMDF
jgi:hypothetical protein